METVLPQRGIVSGGGTSHHSAAAMPMACRRPAAPPPPPVKLEHEPEQEQEAEGGELRRGPWTVDEDMTLVSYIAGHGEGRWNALARAAGLKRTGKSCRLRWLNYLRPDVKRGDFTADEQLLILDLHSRWGNRWSKIAQHLPGRTDNEIKNYWRTRVQKHAKQLNCDANSARFKDAMRFLWMPRLAERASQQSHRPNAAAAADTPPPTTTCLSALTTAPPTTAPGGNNPAAAGMSRYGCHHSPAGSSGISGGSMAVACTTTSSSDSSLTSESTTREEKSVHHHHGRNCIMAAAIETCCDGEYWQAAATQQQQQQQQHGGTESGGIVVHDLWWSSLPAPDMLVADDDCLQFQDDLSGWVQGFSDEGIVNASLPEGNNDISLWSLDDMIWRMQ